LEAGLEEGKKIGLEEGEKIGVSKIVLSLQKNGLGLDEISKLIGLTVEEVQGLI
jgi:predicted transposase YdaD